MDYDTESANNAFPQWIQVDLGSAQSASRVVLQLPASWGARTQTLSLLASTDGSIFTTVKRRRPTASTRPATTPSPSPSPRPPSATSG
ncbi:discoidin domain-containing protein [Actinacidiphila soli]|uniref:discoidin domain-containing protein n=1 Tax=Actinacidiphila soli TaxID=2487275 RepID=UPI002B000BE3|nr:discoidin domain-containing protein [Actinacidiphila soli]